MTDLINKDINLRYTTRFKQQAIKQFRHFHCDKLLTQHQPVNCSYIILTNIVQDIYEKYQF